MNTPKEIDVEDDETPEIKVRLSAGEAGSQIKHFLKVLIEHRGEPRYKDRVKDFLDWFPDEKLEGYLLLCLEYAVDRVAPRKGRGGGGGGSRRP